MSIAMNAELKVALYTERSESYLYAAGVAADGDVCGVAVAVVPNCGWWTKDYKWVSGLKTGVMVAVKRGGEGLQTYS